MISGQQTGTPGGVMEGQDDPAKLTQLIATVARLAAYIPQWLWRIVL